MTTRTLCFLIQSIPAAGNNSGTSVLCLGISHVVVDSALMLGRFSNSLVLNLCAGLVLFILATLFISVYRATPLTNLSINMGRVLASDKELIFDLHAYASNWNWWTVRIPEADISVFAFTQPLSLDDNGTTIHDPAEFLGSVNRFDEPLAFYPSLLIDGPSSAITQIRIKSPGADKSGNENWYLENLLSHLLRQCYLHSSFKVENNPKSIRSNRPRRFQIQHDTLCKALFAISPDIRCGGCRSSH